MNSVDIKALNKDKIYMIYVYGGPEIEDEKFDTH